MPRHSGRAGPDGLIVLDETQAKSRIDLLQAEITSLKKQLAYTKEELQDFEKHSKDRKETTIERFPRFPPRSAR